MKREDGTSTKASATPEQRAIPWLRGLPCLLSETYPRTAWLARTVPSVTGPKPGGFMPINEGGTAEVRLSSFSYRTEVFYF